MTMLVAYLVVGFAVAGCSTPEGRAGADDASVEAGGGAACSTALATGPSGPAQPALRVGPGFSDVSPHQIVRSRANVLYAVVPTCGHYPDCPGNELRAWRGATAGTPSAMLEVDAAHAPRGSPGSIGSSASAIDGCDAVHVLWNERNGTVRYAVLDASTDTWGPATTVAATRWIAFAQGDEGVALAVDAAGTPYAVWNALSEGRLHLFFARRVAGAWTTPVRVDDVALTADRRAIHPAVAFAPDGAFVLAWLEGTDNYFPDGIVRVRTRSAKGTWSASVALPDPAMTAIDNGPSLLVTADGVRHLAYDDVTNHVRTFYDAGQGWKGDRHPAPQVTHNPSLGPDGHGGVYLWGHGAPQDGTLKGEGLDLYRFHLKAGGTAWGPWTLYVKGRFDSSVTTRWSQFFHHYPTTVDAAFWSPDEPNILFVGTE